MYNKDKIKDVFPKPPRREAKQHPQSLDYSATPHHITTYNSFKILSTDEEEDHETRIIDHSIVRDQLQEFCGSAQSTKKRMCMPAGHWDDISADNIIVLIIHVGTNYVINTRSEELLEKYRQMIYV